MLRITVLICLFIITAHAVSSEKPLSDKKIRKICESYGKHSLYMDLEKARKLDEKIHDKGIDRVLCEGHAKKKIENISPKYKKEICENLAAFYYKGSYSEYKQTIKLIEHARFGDQECITIGNFFIRRIERREERRAEISAALNQLLQGFRVNQYQPFQLGTYYNPVHVEIHQ